MPNIDNLDIQITATMNNAISSIDKLVSKINTLQNSMSKVSNIKINGISNASNKVNNLSNNISNFSTKTNSAFKNAKKLSLSIGSIVGTAYAATRGIKKLWSSVENTADYLEAYNYFDVALNKIGNDWKGQYEKYGYSSAEAYANSFSERLNEKLSGLSGIKLDISADGSTGLLTESGLKNLGLNINEITQYASQLASVTNSIGQTGEVSLATASAFTKLGADMSSLFNQDYSSVMKNLQSGLIGQSRALYKYGIDITNATLQTYAYNLGLSKAVSEMTQAEKMQLRMLAILDQSKVSWGDLANTINSPSNAIRQFKNNLQEVSNVFGQLFIPVLSKVMPVINGVTIAIKRMLVSVASLMGIKLDLSSFGQSSVDVSESFDGISDSLENISSSAKKAKAGLRGFDELKVINTPTDNSSTGSAGGGSSIDLTDQILKATEEYEKAWNEAFAQMENKANSFANKITKALEPVKKIFQDFMIGDYFQAGQDVSNLVISINDFFARAIDNVDWYGIGTKIGDFFAGINWIEVFESAGNLMWQGLKGAFELAMGSFDTAPVETVIIGLLTLPVLVGFGSKIIGFIVSPIKNAITTISTIFSTFSSLLAPLTTSITEMFALWSGGAGTLGESFMAVFGVGGIVTVSLAGLAAGLGIAYAKNEEVRESFADSTQAIRDGFQPAVEFITNTLLPDLQKGWEKLQNILSPFTDFLNDTFVSIWNDMINPALKYIGTDILPDITGAFENLWNNVLVPLGNFLASVFEPVIKIVSDVLSMLWKNIVVPLADFIGGIFSTIWENLVDIFNQVVVPNLNKVITIFQFLWNKVLSPLVTFVWGNLKPVFETVFKTIGNVITSLKDIFSGLINFVVGVFTGDLDKALGGIKSIFKGIFNQIASIVEGGINLVINGLNNVIKNVNKITGAIGDAIGVNLTIQTIKKVSIPRLETGGLVMKHTFAEIGEHGKKEAVLPLENKRSMSTIANAITDNMHTGYGTSDMKDVIYSATYNAVYDAMSKNRNTDIQVQANISMDGEPIYKKMLKKAKEDYSANRQSRFVLAEEVY